MSKIHSLHSPSTVIHGFKNGLIHTLHPHHHSLSVGCGECGGGTVEDITWRNASTDPQLGLWKAIAKPTDMLSVGRMRRPEKQNAPH